MNKNVLLKNIIDAQKNGDIDSDLALETIEFIMSNNASAKQPVKKEIVKESFNLTASPDNTASKNPSKINKIKFKISKTTDNCFSITSIEKVGENFYTKPTFVTFKVKYDQFKNLLEEEKLSIKYGKTVYAVLNFDEKNKKVTPYTVYINDRKYTHESNVNKNTYLKSLSKNNVGHFGETLLYNKLSDATADDGNIKIEHTAELNISSPCDITISNAKDDRFYYIDVKSVVHEGLNLQIKSDQFSKRWDMFKDKDFYYCLVKTNWKNEGNKTNSISQSFIHIKDIKNGGQIKKVDRYGRADELVIIDYYSNRNLFIEFDDFVKLI